MFKILILFNELYVNYKCDIILQITNSHTKSDDKLLLRKTRDEKAEQVRCGEINDANAK